MATKKTDTTKKDEPEAKKAPAKARKAVTTAKATTKKPKKPAAKKKPATKKAAAAKEPEAQPEAVEPKPETITPEDVAASVEELSGANRRHRQEASHTVALAAKADSSVLAPHIDDLVDALFRPEAQTRWEVLDALAVYAADGGEGAETAYDGAEASLFDEGSSRVRLSAFRFLAALGATSPERSDEVWPLLDEGIQCFHGDLEYRDMLVALLDFVRGSISPATRDALVERISFDATSGRGYIKTCSADIIAASNEGTK
ncbi:MAG: hypothetical protein PHR15_08620 [Atopobiaceae bacterium]|jgi:hypothetical protein|nr:hypothetical protein [Atopobiaceae bacterium]MCH4180272.1 hypothetical protein [Atopobiaceae bacterium]MCH4214758.1 hypothetical protein [Atopobiaceae bacterium]MCH4229984.1 hypothetical protein [Atopobiaceae bacterium]MCH4276933.1 hypothetical protein [Atopobiaceae bacterium]